MSGSGVTDIQISNFMSASPETFLQHNSKFLRIRIRTFYRCGSGLFYLLYYNFVDSFILYIALLWIRIRTVPNNLTCKGTDPDTTASEFGFNDGVSELLYSPDFFSTFFVFRMRIRRLFAPLL